MRAVVAAKLGFNRFLGQKASINLLLPRSEERKKARNEQKGKKEKIIKEIVYTYVVERLSVLDLEINFSFTE